MPVLIRRAVLPDRRLPGSRLHPHYEANLACSVSYAARSPVLPIARLPARFFDLVVELYLQRGRFPTSGSHPTSMFFGWEARCPWQTEKWMKMCAY